MLEIKNLYVKYNGARNASIQGISLKVEKGDRIAILGPSGCGKTTLLHVVAGLLKAKEAKIEGVLDWRFDEKKPIIRMVFQEATLLPWRTVEKNIAFGLEIKKIAKSQIKEKVEEILEIIRLNPNAKNYPHELSIGMQQRVNFARALVCEPNLILLDEPFSALDVETKRDLQEEFLRIIKAKKITAIFVTHNMQEAVTMANKIVVLSNKPSKILRVIENGNLDFAIDEDKTFLDLDE